MVRIIVKEIRTTEKSKLGREMETNGNMYVTVKWVIE